MSQTAKILVPVEELKSNNEGEYDESGIGVFGRKVIYRNIKEILDIGFESQKGRMIVAKFCIAPTGDVTYVELLDETTASLSSSKKKAVIKAITGYKLEADINAPSKQCGKFNVTLNVNTSWGG